jgi:superfamily II DNA/RNA helicase
MGQVNSVGDNIVQSTQFVSKDGKFEMLVDALREHDQSAIVFMNSKFATEKMAKRLKSAGITAEGHSRRFAPKQTRTRHFKFARQ